MSTYVPLRSIHVREGFNVRGLLPNIPKLADDIAERGQLEPITVRAIVSHHGSELHHLGTWTDTTYEVVSGHRRYAALCYLCEKKRQVPNYEIRELKSAIASAREGGYAEFRRMMLPVDGDFPVAVHVVEMSDEEAYLANLAENAHSEGMRQVDVMLRAQRMLQEGTDKARVVRALGISQQTLDARLSAVRRLSPEIIDLWKKIERPEHEPPWHLLHDVARGGAKRGRGGVPVPPAVASEQLKVWMTFYGSKGTTKLSSPTWREPHRIRSVREIRMKEKELRASGAGDRADVLLWVLGKTDRI